MYLHKQVDMETHCMTMKKDSQQYVKKKVQFKAAQAEKYEFSDSWVKRQKH